MNYRLPCGWENAEDACQSIECRGGKGGQYPAGKNHCWHSGLHCHGSQPVFPIIDGTVTACRYSDSTGAIPRSKKITEDDYRRLNDLERELYCQQEERDSRFHLYSLKYEHLDESAFNDLCKEHEGIESWFRLKETGYEPIEEASTEYIILKHEVNFPEHKEQTFKITFFTLYMGLEIFISEFKDYYNNFKNIVSDITDKDLPAFQKWKFRLKYNRPQQRRYKKYDDFNIFEYSTFSYKYTYGDDDTKCLFTNDPNRDNYIDDPNRDNYIDDPNRSNYVNVPNDCIIKDTSKYKTNRDNVEVFKIPENGLPPNIQTATIKKDKPFSLFVPFNNDYYMVIVDRSDCNPDSYNRSLCGWVANLSPVQGNDTVPLGANQFAYRINPNTNFPNNHFAIRRRDYFEYKGTTAVLRNMTLAEIEQPVIINKNIPQNPVTKITFYYRERKIDKIIVDENDYNYLQRKKIEGTDGFTSYTWERVMYFMPGDYAAKIDGNNGLEPYVIRDDYLTYCHLSYPKSGNIHNALMRKTDLTEEGNGYLKNNSENNALQAFLDDETRGCMFYDSYSNDKFGNARLCLTQNEMGFSDEFEMNNPKQLLENFTPNRAYDIEYSSDGKKHQGSLYINNGVTVEAKIECLEGFNSFNTINTPAEYKVNRNSILGYPAAIPKEREPFFDMVLFFDEKDINETLFNNNHWSDYPETQCFIKPENFSPIYKKGENTDSVFDHIDSAEREELNPVIELGKPVDMVTVDSAAGEATIFYGFKINNKVYYVTGDSERPYSLEEKNYLNFSDFFKAMNKSGTANDIYCDLELILQDINSENISNLVEKYLEIFYRSKDNNREKRKKIRSLICKHHLEWNKTLYNDNNRLLNRLGLISIDGRDRFLNTVGIQDLWTNPDGSEVQEEDLSKLPPKEQIWFAHPVYFINHLDKAGLLDKSYNPYFGSHQTTGGVWFDCCDNPGFAPLWEQREGDIYDKKQFKDNNGNYYAMVTAEFNRLMFNSYYHEGVDFRGDYGRDIKSFIYADVIGCGWGVGKLAPYGRTIILGNKNGHGLYLLGHLQNFEVGEGDSVEPNDLVAKVGKSGYGEDRCPKFDGQHLHLSYYDYSYEPSKRNTDYLIKGTNNGKTTIDFTQAIIDRLNSRLNNITKDPFNHKTERRFQ